MMEHLLLGLREGENVSCLWCLQVSGRRVGKRWSLTLPGGADWKDWSQWAQVTSLEIPLLDQVVVSTKGAEHWNRLPREVI